MVYYLLTGKRSIITYHQMYAILQGNECIRKFPAVNVYFDIIHDVCTAPTLDFRTKRYHVFSSFSVGRYLIIKSSKVSKNLLQFSGLIPPFFSVLSLIASS